MDGNGVEEIFFLFRTLSEFVLLIWYQSPSFGSSVKAKRDHRALMISTKDKNYKKSAKGRRENIWLSVMIHGPRCARSVCHVLEPNTFSSAPPPSPFPFSCPPPPQRLPFSHPVYEQIVMSRELHRIRQRCTVFSRLKAGLEKTLSQNCRF